MSTRNYCYSITEYEEGGTESKTVRILAGDVWAMKSDVKSNETFSSCTVLGIAKGKDIVGFKTDFWVRLARPYCYASSTGTTSPSPLTGCEIFEVTTKQFVERFTHLSQGYTK